MASEKIALSLSTRHLSLFAQLPLRSGPGPCHVERKPALSEVEWVEISLIVMIQGQQEIDSFVPAHSDFGLPFHVARFPAHSSIPLGVTRLAGALGVVPHLIC